eukprot:scaffold2053_cov106-Skeletonema_dohrnii-CCMP3373.AAC.8
MKGTCTPLSYPRQASSAREVSPYRAYLCGLLVNGVSLGNTSDLPFASVHLKRRSEDGPAQQPSRLSSLSLN